MGATLSCPLFSTRAFWSPLRRASTTKYGPVEQSNPLSRWLPQITRNLSTKSSKLEVLTHTHTHHPTLAAADEHPEEAGEFQHHSGGRFGAVGRCFQLRNKKDASREKSWAPLIRRVDPPLANALLRLLDAFLDARSRSKRVHRVCAALRTQSLVLNDPPERVMEAQLRKRWARHCLG